jgi:hypothetical protein
MSKRRGKLEEMDYNRRIGSATDYHKRGKNPAISEEDPDQAGNAQYFKGNRAHS